MKKIILLAFWGLLWAQISAQGGWEKVLDNNGLQSRAIDFWEAPSGDFLVLYNDFSGTSPNLIGSLHLLFGCFSGRVNPTTVGHIVGRHLSQKARQAAIQSPRCVYGTRHHPPRFILD